MEPISKLGRRLPVRYSLVAILFLLFDVELVFLFPWAAWWGSLGEGGTEQALRVLGFVEVSIFLGFLTVGYIYIWRRGGLEWD
jgi:NADH-quinone oxidoreductase subunit A